MVMQTLTITDTHFCSLKTKRERLKKKNPENRKGNWNNNTYATIFCQIVFF